MARVALILIVIACGWLGGGLVGGPAMALDLQRLRMLTPQEHIPWRAVGRVNIGGYREIGMCTGTLIGEDVVLTAAHCVVNEQTGLTYSPDMIHFVAGWRLGVKVASSVAAHIYVHPAYLAAGADTEHRIGYDMALIRLADPIPRAKAPYFEVGTAPRRGTPVTLISYRRDRPNALTRQEGCKITDIEKPVLVLDCEVTFGASGSPLFAEQDGEMKVVAVMAAMGRDPSHPVAYAVTVDAALGEVLAQLK